MSSHPPSGQAPISASKLKQNLPPSPPKKTLQLDDCERPACDDMVTKLSQMAAMASNNSGAVSASTTIPKSTTHPHLVQPDETMSLTTTTADSSNNDNQIIKCPPSKSEIGTGSWTLLHSMAAWYPNEPTNKDREQMTQFFAAFARFYPCTWCAKDFVQNLQSKPVQTQSRKALCQWICEQHNVVNEKLGKPLFPCDMTSLDERWRKSSKEQCQPQAPPPKTGNGHD